MYRICAAVMVLLVVAAPQASFAQHIGGRAARLSRLPESISNKDPSIHYDAAILAPGTSRERVHAAFGAPNGTQGEGAALEEVYAFHSDGAKFVEPRVTGGTIAAAVFTGGMSLAVRKARSSIQENQLTIYRVHYDGASKIKSVEVMPPGSAALEPASPAH